MNTQLLFLCILVSFSLNKLSAQIKATDPVYVNTISTSDLSIDLTVGLYPLTYKYEKAYDYSILTLKILNDSKKDFDWNDYRVFILLRDGTLFSSYKTKSEKGEYLNKYIIDSGDLHTQTVCFGRAFDVDDIKYAWLSWVEEKFFTLPYVEGK